MQTVSDPQSLREQVQAWQKNGLTVALVPTMGNLHAGHLSLIDRAREAADRVVVSVFVNPLQFGPNEDFDDYPRTLTDDERQCRQQGADLLFAPGVAVMYPGYRHGQPYLTTRLQADPLLAQTFEGADRPGHFDGVVTVVAKLFHLVQPDVAVFGQKDLQQYAVLEKMVTDLAMPVRLVRAPIVRETDGLALSSRNQYLNSAERALAPSLAQTLQSVCVRIQDAPAKSESILQQASQDLQALGFQVHYFSLVALPTLQAVVDPQMPCRDDGSEFAVVVAATLGQTRLLDNRILRLS
ncbi:MAG: pantoate--beta-alanine ligase [Hydrogenovibrio sp.]|uniref:pantoate--beta-alanine ligase n=1 Tax=Hydrogenovibrio sp. TaxID=2065821 RepID=UPI00286FD23C|nr:pantoate--beta-alanine ligase [Hydrogenovibrio sp.]MDR9497863.1 pantoate--beta-alanine ligase [Hydrogenovibrio sp.]